MILTFGDRTTEDLFHGRNTARVRRIPQQIRSRARHRLDVLNAATRLDDLKSPGNNLELLKGDFAGFWSIRVNDQWRVIFHWAHGDALDVRLIDYH